MAIHGPVVAGVEGSVGSNRAKKWTSCFASSRSGRGRRAAGRRSGPCAARRGDAFALPRPTARPAPTAVAMTYTSASKVWWRRRSAVSSQS